MRALFFADRSLHNEARVEFAFRVELLEIASRSLIQPLLHVPQTVLTLISGLLLICTGFLPIPAFWVYVYACANGDTFFQQTVSQSANATEHVNCGYRLVGR